MSIGTVPGPFAVAQDGQPTASELYRQGIERYEAGELDAARQAFRRVDPMLLPRQERVRLYRTLQAIDRSGTAGGDAVAVDAVAAEEPAGTSAAELLAQADEAATSDPAAAASLYQQVLGAPEAGDSLKAVANARLAQSQRRINADVTEVRRQLDLANADLEAGDAATARGRLQNIQQSDAQLGWFDQQRLDRLAAAVEEREAAASVMAQPAPAEAGGVEPGAAGTGATGRAETTVDAAAAVEPEVDPAAAMEADASVSVPPVAAADPVAPDSDLMDQYVRLQARQALEEGRAAEERGEINLARDRYRRALQLNPEVGGAAEALAALESRRGADLSPGSPIEQRRQALEIGRQRASSEYEAAMNRARSAQSAGNYDAALEHTANARVILDRNERLLSPEAYTELRNAAESLSSQIVDQRDRQRLARIEAEAAAQRQELDQARDRARLEQAEEINSLLLRAREHQKDQRYDEALQLVNQALFLDPTNLATQMMRDILEDNRIFANSRELLRRRDVGLGQMQVDGIEATIPYNDLITYPSDWPQLTDTRLRGLEADNGDSEINRRVMAQLREPIPVDFNAARLENVLEYFRSVTSVNVFVNWSALETAGVERDTVVSLQLTNVPAEQALRLVLQQAGANAEFDPIGYSIIEGIVTISTQRDLQRTTDLRPYDIRDLLVEIPNFDNYPEFDLSEAMDSSGSGSGGGGGSSLFGDDQDDDEDTGPTRAELVEQIVTLIQDTVGRPEDWQAYGGDVSSVRELNGQLIIKTTPDGHRQISTLLSQLRETRAIQISVEARFLLVDQNFLEEIGFDLDMQWNNPGGNFGPISIAQDSIGLARRGLTTLSPDNLGSSDDQATQPGPFVPGIGFAPTNRALDLGITYLDDLEVNLIVNATQYHQEAISLTAPRVTFFNGQQAYVLVVRQIAFVSELEPVPDAIGFDVETDVVQSGAILVVQGTVSADRRYVTMTLQPSLARVQEPIPVFPVQGVIDDDTGTGGIPTPIEDRVFTGFIQLPTLELTQVAATVSVPDRGTLLIGGQRLVAETEVESGVPVLSKIPIVNRFFTNNSTVKDSRTLLILIRPTIIIQGETEQQLFPGIQQAPSSFNMGGF